MRDRLHYCQATRQGKPCVVFLRRYGDATQVELEAKLRLLAMANSLELVG